MSLSLITYLIIGESDVICTAAGPDEKTGKYTGWVLLDTDRWHPLIDSGPVYFTKQQAVDAMMKFVDIIKANPPDNSSGHEHLISKEVAQEIVNVLQPKDEK